MKIALGVLVILGIGLAIAIAPDAMRYMKMSKM